jgi:hypothetical protein
MRAYEILNEIHAADFFPKTFEAFRKKYMPLAHRQDLYVNFGDHAGNTLDRNFSPVPNHSDPAGLYAYPLEYVLNHPADIQYGQQTRYLRVIQDTSAHKLVLNDLTKDTAISILTKMGIADPEKKMNMIQRVGQFQQGNIIAKAFFAVVQSYTQVGQKVKHDNATQTAFFLKAGIDALEDKSRSEHEAIIYRAEPEQIVFMKRSAFKVIDVFELRNRAATQAEIGSADHTEQLQRLPAMIAKAIGDRLVSSNAVGGEHETTYYTAAKRKIVVILDKDYSFMRKHRENTESTASKMAVTLQGPGFKPIKVQYDNTASFTEIAADMAERFKNVEPHRGDEYSYEKEYGPKLAQKIERIKAIADRFKLPFTEEMSQKTAQLLVKSLEAANEKTFSFNTKKSYMDKVFAFMDEFWSKQRARPVQVDQVQNIFKKASTDKRVRGNGRMNMEEIANYLGISVASKGESFAKQYGDISIQREGDAVSITIDGETMPLTEVNNNKISAMKKPNGDPALFTKYAKEIADYFNDQHFFCESWAVHMPETLGVTFVNGEWKPFQEFSESLGKLGNDPIWKIPSPGEDAPKSYYITLALNGEAPDRVGKIERWSDLAWLVIVNDKDEITSVSGTVSRYQRFKTQKNRFKSSSYHDAAERRLEDALEAGNFDLLKFVKQHKLKLGSNLQTSDLEVFGLIRNESTHKTGKTISEVATPMGHYAGLQVFHAAIKPAWSSTVWYYGVMEGNEFKEMMTTESSYLDSSAARQKILNIAPNLSNTQRQALKDVIAELELRLPTALKTNLSRTKS